MKLEFEYPIEYLKMGFGIIFLLVKTSQSKNQKSDDKFQYKIKFTNIPS